MTLTSLCCSFLNTYFSTLLTLSWTVQCLATELSTLLHSRWQHLAHEMIALLAASASLCIPGSWVGPTYEMFWAFLVLWSMQIQELHDATRETLSNFVRTILKARLSAKTVLHCLRVLRGAATNYRIQTERRRLRTFVISVRPCTLLHFFVIHK